MAKNVGWIKLFRKLIDNRIYFEEPFDKTHAWIDMILVADSDGAINTSIKQLANRWKWSEGKVRRFLERLSEDGMVRTNGSHGGSTNGTTVSIVKYSEYQCGRRTDGSTDGSTDELSEWGKGDIYNINITRRKEEKNISPNILSDITPKGGAKKFVKPTLEEVEDFCYEQNLGIDPAEFIDHYETNGWRVGKNPMKDWKAAARNWDRRRKTDSRTGNYNGGGKNARAAEDMHNGFNMIDSLVARMEKSNDIS